MRVALGVGGLLAIGWIVEHVGVDVVLATLRGAWVWLPVLVVVELGRIGCSAAGSAFAFGPLASRIPKTTLLYAHILGHSIGNIAPAPTVVNETIKATLLAPRTSGPAAAAVGFINQAATLMAVGLLSIPCGLAILALQGASLWFWASVIHAIVMVSVGIVLQLLTRAGATAKIIEKRIPRLAERASIFRDHMASTDLGAVRTTGMLLLGRCLQMVEYAVAAYAVGIDVTLVRAMAAQGVSLIANAVGVLVPGGLGTTEGAFTLAADLLGTSVVRATSLALLVRSMQLLWLVAASLMAFATIRRRIDKKNLPD